MIHKFRNQHPITWLCALVDVAKSGYQAWCAGKVTSSHKLEDVRLVFAIKTAHQRGRGIYGPEKIQTELLTQGIAAGLNRIKRLRKLHGIRCTHKKKFKVTTDSKHSLPIAQNVLNRQFAIGQIRHAVYASPEYLKVAGAPKTPDDLPHHLCLVIKAPGMNRPLEEWEFQRGAERKVIQVAPRVVTYDREGLIAAVLAGAGLMRLGCFDPYLISSGQLHKVHTDWTCPPGFPIFAMHRKTARKPPKLPRFWSLSKKRSPPSILRKSRCFIVTTTSRRNIKEPRYAPPHEAR